MAPKRTNRSQRTRVVNAVYNPNATCLDPTEENLQRKAKNLALAELKEEEQHSDWSRYAEQMRQKESQSRKNQNKPEEFVPDQTEFRPPIIDETTARTLTCDTVLPSSCKTRSQTRAQYSTSLVDLSTRTSSSTTAASFRDENYNASTTTKKERTSIRKSQRRSANSSESNYNEAAQQDADETRKSSYFTPSDVATCAAFGSNTFESLSSGNPNETELNLFDKFQSTRIQDRACFNMSSIDSSDESALPVNVNATKPQNVTKTTEKPSVSVVVDHVSKRHSKSVGKVEPDCPAPADLLHQQLPNANIELINSESQLKQGVNAENGDTDKVNCVPQQVALQSDDHAVANVQPDQLTATRLNSSDMVIESHNSTQQSSDTNRQQDALSPVLHKRVNRSHSKSLSKSRLRTSKVASILSATSKTVTEEAEAEAEAQAELQNTNGNQAQIEVTQTGAQSNLPNQEEHENIEDAERIMSSAVVKMSHADSLLKRTLLKNSYILADAVVSPRQESTSVPRRSNRTETNRQLKNARLAKGSTSNNANQSSASASGVPAKDATFSIHETSQDQSSSSKQSKASSRRKSRREVTPDQPLDAAQADSGTTNAPDITTQNDILMQSDVHMRTVESVQLDMNTQTDLDMQNDVHMQTEVHTDCSDGTVSRYTETLRDGDLEETAKPRRAAKSSSRASYSTSTVRRVEKSIGSKRVSQVDTFGGDSRMSVQPFSTRLTLGFTQNESVQTSFSGKTTVGMQTRLSCAGMQTTLPDMCNVSTSMTGRPPSVSSSLQTSESNLAKPEQSGVTYCQDSSTCNDPSKAQSSVYKQSEAIEASIHTESSIGDHSDSSKALSSVHKQSEAIEASIQAESSIGDHSDSSKAQSSVNKQSEAIEASIQAESSIEDHSDSSKTQSSLHKQSGAVEASDRSEAPIPGDSESSAEPYSNPSQSLLSSNQKCEATSTGTDRLPCEPSHNSHVAVTNFGRQSTITDAENHVAASSAVQSTTRNQEIRQTTDRMDEKSNAKRTDTDETMLAGCVGSHTVAKCGKSIPLRSDEAIVNSTPTSRQALDVNHCNTDTSAVVDNASEDDLCDISCEIPTIPSGLVSYAAAPSRMNSVAFIKDSLAQIASQRSYQFVPPKLLVDYDITREITIHAPAALAAKRQRAAQPAPVLVQPTVSNTSVSSAVQPHVKLQQVTTASDTPPVISQANAAVVMPVPCETAEQAQQNAGTNHAQPNQVIEANIMTKRKSKTAAAISRRLGIVRNNDESPLSTDESRELAVLVNRRNNRRLANQLKRKSRLTLAGRLSPRKMSVSTSIESNTDSVDHPRRLSASFSFAVGSSPSASTLPQSTYSLFASETGQKTVLIDSESSDSAIHASGGHREVATSMTINYEDNCDPFDLTLIGDTVQPVSSRDCAPAVFKRPSPVQHESERPAFQTNSPLEPAFPDISTASPGWPADDNREEDMHPAPQKRVHFAYKNAHSGNLHTPRYAGSARCVAMRMEPSFLDSTLGLQDSNELEDLSLRDPSVPSNRKANVGVLCLAHTRLKLDMQKIISRCRRWDTYYRNRIAQHKYEARADRNVTPEVRRSQRNRVSSRLAAHERLVYRYSHGFPVLTGVEAHPDPPSPIPRGILRNIQYECDKEMIEEAQSTSRKRRAAMQRRRFEQLPANDESHTSRSVNLSSSLVPDQDSLLNIDSAMQHHRDLRHAAVATRDKPQKASSRSKPKDNNLATLRSPDIAKPKRVVFTVNDSDIMDL